MGRSILLIEDDLDFAQLVCISLREENFVVTTANDGVSGLELAQKGSFDLILLDLMLPGIDGLEVCRSIRASGDHTPLLMLTARDTELDRVLGLEVGADDYMPKTMGVRELVARVRAALRRSRAYGEEVDVDWLQRGDLQIHPGKREVLRGEETLELTAKEFDLLLHFAQNPGRVFSREDLLSSVWGYAYEGYQHTVNSHINRLRGKIEHDVSKPKYLLTVWGVGYKFNEQWEKQA
ncbi:MAG: DNA-binding response regulator [Planctomycetota bacterium]|nr:MAG: DNA-binding response regulator [Planctomycetota bacterium]